MQTDSNRNLILKYSIKFQKSQNLKLNKRS